MDILERGHYSGYHNSLPWSSEGTVAGGIFTLADVNESTYSQPGTLSGHITQPSVRLCHCNQPHFIGETLAV